MANRADYINVSDEYFVAIEASDVAHAEFAEATKEFRVNGDYAAFGEAQKAYAIARKAFDAAYDAEMNREEVATIAVVDRDDQLVLI